MLVLLLLLVCACVVWLMRARVRQSCAHALPPAYPGELPIVGHLHLLLTDTSKLWQLLRSVAMDSVKQGGVTYTMLGKLTYIITDPEDGLTVANACLQKFFAYKFAQPWLGQGLFTGSGPKWLNRRKLMCPAFSVTGVHSFLEVFNDQARKFNETVDCYVGKSEFDAVLRLKKLALETSCLTIFGNTNLKSSSFFSKYLDELDKMLHLLINRFQTVWQHSEFIYSLWLKKKENKVLNTLNELPDEAVQKFKGTLKSEATLDTSYKPILHQILQPFGKDFLTDIEIREELNTFIFASFESTSISIAYVLALLGSYPEVQEKVYEEVIAVVGVDGDVNKYDLQKLAYTEAVIKESIRLFPPLPFTGRYIDKDVKLKNYTLRAGSDCVLMFHGMNRHQSWGPDAEQFKPERWLDPASLPANAFGTFSIGKRFCLGKTYAIVAIKVTLAHLIRKYRWTADYTKLQLKMDVTLKPVTGHEITLQRRS